MIHTTLDPTRRIRSARCLLAAGTLTIATALVGGALQSPTATHAMGITGRAQRYTLTPPSHSYLSRSLLSRSFRPSPLFKWA
jgi:hypothetical protein